MDLYINHLFFKCPQVYATKHFWWWVNTGSNNGLMPSDNKPLPEPTLTQVCISLWRHEATIGEFAVDG